MRPVPLPLRSLPLRSLPPRTPTLRPRRPRPARAVLLAALALPVLLCGQPVRAQDRLPAILDGQAVLPAGATVAPPAGSPAFVATAGKFTGPENRRTEAQGSIPGRTGAGPGGRETGFALPVREQPLQGVSSLRAAGDGSYWALSDNGFGGKANSADALLAIHRLRPDWQAGTVERRTTVFLSDPDRRMPFPITLEGTEGRLLTGADLDPESLVVTADGFWVGDEFGPWLLHFAPDGRLLGLWETVASGRVVRSPDHPAVRTPSAPDGTVPFEVTRSRGFEGLAASPDGRFLYAMLEGPLVLDGKRETWADGRPRLRWLEFDTRAEDGRGAWTGRVLFYPLEADANAIGEVTMLDGERALVIERDGGEGDAALACPEAAPAPTCFERPARFKRLYLVSRKDTMDGGAVRKLAYVDLLAIADPDGRARQGATPDPRGGTRLALPFTTIESVEPAGADRVVVVNDNNFPFSAGRALDRADDTEFVLLRVPELLSRQ